MTLKSSIKNSHIEHDLLLISKRKHHLCKKTSYTVKGHYRQTKIWIARTDRSSGEGRGGHISKTIGEQKISRRQGDTLLVIKPYVISMWRKVGENEQSGVAFVWGGRSEREVVSVK
jgi:hypothetical protein